MMTRENRKEAVAKLRTPEEELRWLCDFSVTTCVAHVSEFSPGTEYFDADDAEVLLKSLQQTPDLTGVLLDGFAGVRRPGILDDSMVFYNRTEEDVLKQLEEVAAHDHVHWMFKELMKIVGLWFGKFRAALPGKKIVYSVDSDDASSTCERLLRVLVQSAKAKVAIRKKSFEELIEKLQKSLDGFDKIKEADLQVKLGELEEKREKLIEARGKSGLKWIDGRIARVKADIALITKRDELEATRQLCIKEKNEKLQKTIETELVAVKSSISIKEQGLLKARLQLVGQRRMLVGKSGKQDERDALDVEIKKCEDRIEGVKTRIRHVMVKLEEMEKKASNQREAETSPNYQLTTPEHMRKFYKRFSELGDKHGIDIITNPEILVYNDLVIDYAHDRGRTWHPMPGRVKRLAEAYHGLMNDYRENIGTILNERKAPVNDIDVVMESGHHGVFFARWQKLYLTEEEIRMQHVNTFYTGEGDDVKHVTYIVGMPFEPQDKIASYLNRKKPGRTRGDKVMGSASHPVFIRNSQGSVSGVTLVRKHNHGFISVEPITYQLYRNKQVLEPFKGVMVQSDSDNHFNSPEHDPLATLGTLTMNEQLMQNPLVLYGQKVFLGGNFNIGDTAEASSKSWREATKFRRNVMEMVGDIPSQLVATDISDYESVLKTALLWANDMMGGANENFKLTMRVVAWYFKKQFLNIYHKSPSRLRDIFLAIEGNHFANGNRDTGLQEFTLFEEWLLAEKTRHEDFPEKGGKPFPLRIVAGGEPQYFQPDTGKNEMVVHLGGYSVSRQAIIPQYGVGYDGKLCVQKPYRVGFSHEPNSVLNKARNHRADWFNTGHTHESTLTADNIGHNKARFLDQKPCTQRVSGTELIYGGIPRTAGVDINVLSQPGRIFKMTIPSGHMRRIGLATLRVRAKQAVENRKLVIAKK